MLRYTLLALALAPLGAAFAQTAADTAAQTGSGTLTVEIKNFSSEQPLPKKAEKQLRSGGLEWGIKDNQIVFTMVGKQFVDFPINHMTRYGQSESLPLPAGDYRITGIGLEMSTAFSVQKILDKGAFVNPDIVTFRIENGKTTTLSINPVIYKDATFAVNFWMPTLMASVVTDAGSGEAKALNKRIETSIAWPQYTGPLKFVAK
ncbi:hypothetical protein [Pseudomonas sp. CGJS7]|uniref:hypothetical protein n=1 Tax=Pseudomonas sp. CGJS7 TaxID=3109348 RepID=UPI00300B3BEA